MEELVREVKEAEAKATAVREAATKRALEIAAEAEERERALLAEGERKNALHAEQEIARAERESQAEYEAAMETSRRAATDYADALIKDTKTLVSAIVGRVLRDR